MEPCRAQRSPVGRASAPVPSTRHGGGHAARPRGSSRVTRPGSGGAGTERLVFGGRWLLLTPSHSSPEVTDSRAEQPQPEHASPQTSPPLSGSSAEGSSSTPPPAGGDRSVTSLCLRKGSGVLSGDQREGFCPGREATGTDAPRGKQPGTGTLWAQRGSPDSCRPTPCQALLGTSVPLDTGGMLTPNLRARTLSPGRLREPLLQMALLANVPAGGSHPMPGEEPLWGSPRSVDSPHGEGSVSFKEPRPPCSS